MFHFPALPPPALCVQTGVIGNYARQVSLFGNPRIMSGCRLPGASAGSNVLHRLLVPRHPPCALINLATTIDARVHCAVLRYGGSQNAQCRPVRGKGVLGPKGGALRPVPSGPNSVLGQAIAAATFPGPKGPY